MAGNGQSELLEALAGILAPSRGEIVFAGPGPGARAAAARARGARLGLAHVPEDRLRMGVVGDFTAQDNAILGQQDRPGLQPRGTAAAGRHLCRVRDARCTITTCGRLSPAGVLAAFSGGNQQKLVLAREIDGDPQVLLVGQPTRGVDIGAVEFIHRRLVALRDAGKGAAAGVGRTGGNSRRSPTASW